MNNQILYLIQSEFNQTEQVFSKLKQISCSDDAVVLLGDAVLFVEHPELKDIKQVYILENDAEILVNPLPQHVVKMDYSAFASLVLQFERCIRLK